jgi:hypothetical protein
LNSPPLYGVDLKVAGAPASSAGSYTLARMAACEQTSAHQLHWMQIFGSHTGISSATLRFSHWVVPTGHVPSTENALTGSESPWPCMIVAVTFLTKSGAASGTTGGRLRVVVGAAGTGTSAMCSSLASTAFQLACTTAGPRFP